MKLLLFLYFLFQFPLAISQVETDCGSDFESPEVKALETLSQGQYGSCYAHSAATLIDAYRLKNKVPGDLITYDNLEDYRTSPMDTFIQYQFTSNFKSETEQLRGGGNGSYAIKKSYMEKGICPKSLVEGRNLDGFELTEFFKSLGPEYLDYVKKMKGQKIYGQAKKSKLAREHAEKLECSLSDSFGLDNSQIENVEKIIRALVSDSLQEFYSKLMDIKCADKRLKAPKDFPDPKLRLFAYPKEVFQTLVSNLDKNIPVGIGMCSRLLLQPLPYKGVKSFSKNILDKRCINHAVVIYGKRKVNGICQFKIRNSWTPGKTCEVNAKPYFDSSKSTGGFSKCDPETGDMWIDWKDLRNNTYGMYWI